MQDKLIAENKVFREDCQNCEGTGQHEPNCGLCEGKGWLEDEEDGGTKVCPECHDEKCTECEP